MRRIRSTILFAAALTVGSLILPATAQAQHYRGGVHVSVGVGYGWGPGPWMYGQWGPWGPWGPYAGYGYGWYGPWAPYSGYGWGMPYPYYGYYNATGYVSSLKVQATQKALKDAEVYVDGALAGTVEDFDGLFQSLHVKPGSREIVLYKEGFRSGRQTVYIEPFDEKKLKFTLELLREGEPQDPRPTLPPPGVEPDPARAEHPYARYARPPVDPDPEPQQQREAEARIGTLSVRVQPGDAEILVDGERWTASAQPDRLNLKLTAGRHKVEVRKEGFVTYAEDVLIRDQATMTLNILLTRR